MVAQREPSPINHLSSISTSSSRLSNHPSRMSLYNHCGYNLPESGFDRIKCHCPNVYNHLSANNIHKSSFTSPKAIWMMNEQQPSSPPSRTRTRKMPKYQVASNLMKNIVKSKESFSWHQQASVVKLVGSFLIGILFLSLVAMAVLIRVETKVPPRPTTTTTITRTATAAKLTTSALNDADNVLLASSTTETSSSISNIANNEDENNRRVENMALFLGKQPRMPELHKAIYIADHTNESLKSSKLDSSIQGYDTLRQQSPFAKTSFIPIKLIIDDINVGPSIQNHGQRTTKLPSTVTTSSSIFSTESKSKRIIIEMDIKVNQTLN